MEENTWTQEEMWEFQELVELVESRYQMDRIDGRLRMPKFIERVGKAKCDAMFEVLKREVPEND